MSGALAIKTDDVTPDSLPALVDRAAQTLAGARTAAEVLEARNLASLAYDVAKTQGRLLRAKDAHDELLGAVYRAQADALDIEAQAKRRLADEYDEAQKAGLAAKKGRPKKHGDSVNFPATQKQLGFRHNDEVDEARAIRDAERQRPGVVRDTLDAKLAAGEEPTRTAVRRAVRIAFERRKPHIESVTMLAEDALPPEDADNTIRDLAYYVKGVFLNPPPGIRACLKEAMARASREDVRVIAAAAHFLTELKEAAK